ncbi:MAG TPA: hypothetical protein VFZ21_29715 [Gemmatimonadaceae bacterium]|jgi:hypothetical protein|nr:hypothetical protein [Gemmatimonadaceae bacterium]
MMPNVVLEAIPRARGCVLTGAAGFILSFAAADRVEAQDRRLVTRLDSTTATAVTRIVDSVRTTGLPAEPLIGVALEGATRRASGDRIVTAVREYASALGAARQALGESSQSDEIVSAAGVIVAGVTPTAVGAFRAARPSGSLTVPLVVLADLVARGVPAESAAATLGEALRNGALDSELTEFRRRVERDILAGARPATAMSLRTRDLPGRSAGGRIGPPAPRRPNAVRPRRPGPG